MNIYQGKVTVVDVVRAAPPVKSVTLSMTGDFYDALVAVLREHASLYRQGVTDTGTAVDVLEEIETVVVANHPVDDGVPPGWFKAVAEAYVRKVLLAKEEG